MKTSKKRHFFDSAQKSLISDRGVGKKGISRVVTAILLILLAIAAVIIVWYVYKKLVNQDTDAGLVLSDLEIESVKPVSAYGYEIRVKRNPGYGNVVKLKFVFINEAGESEVYSYDYSINELDIKKIQTDAITIANPVKVEVYPVILTQKGNEILGPKKDELEINGGNPPIIDNIFEDGTVRTNSGMDPPGTPYIKDNTGTSLNIENMANDIRPYIEFDVSSINNPDTITEVYLKVYVTKEITQLPATSPSKIHPLLIRPSLSSAQEIFQDMTTDYVSDNNLFRGSVPYWETINLGSQAVIDLKTSINSGKDWFALGINTIYADMAHISSEESNYGPELIITYY